MGGAEALFLDPGTLIRSGVRTPAGDDLDEAFAAEASPVAVKVERNPGLPDLFGQNLFFSAVIVRPWERILIVYAIGPKNRPLGYIFRVILTSMEGLC